VAANRSGATAAKKGSLHTNALPAATQGLFVPAAGRRAAQSAQVNALLVERNSQRSIAGTTGVASMTIAKRLKKAAVPSPLLPRLRPKKRNVSAGKRWS
jgi:hypothetical protein